MEHVCLSVTPTLTCRSPQLAAVAELGCVCGYDAAWATHQPEAEQATDSCPQKVWELVRNHS
jgi:hypothetical protein